RIALTFRSWLSPGSLRLPLRPLPVRARHPAPPGKEQDGHTPQKEEGRRTVRVAGPRAANQVPTPVADRPPAHRAAAGRRDQARADLSQRTAADERGSVYSVLGSGLARREQLRRCRTNE